MTTLLKKPVKSENESFEQYRFQQTSLIADFLDSHIHERKKWIKRNQYYYDTLSKIVVETIPAHSKVCHLGCSSPRLLSLINPSEGFGICFTNKQKEYCQQQNPQFKFFTFENFPFLKAKEKFDYIVINSLGYFFDIQEIFSELNSFCHTNTKIIISNYNFLWEPIFSIGEKIKLRMPQPIQRQNMVPTSDILNLLDIYSLQEVRRSSHLLVPKKIPLVSWFINKFFSGVFPFRFLSSTDLIVARAIIKPTNKTSCSIIIPCKNEEGHIKSIIERMPHLGSHTEIIFIDDKSTDQTRNKIIEFQKLYPEKDIKLIDGPGICKAEAVRQGCLKAHGDILAILDGDIAVAPEELPKCIEPLLNGTADFVNTVRFVYPQQDKAMRFLNIVGNRGFALIFTFLLRQRITDTLSGTKVFWKKDYLNINNLKDNWIWRDKWGDFEQLLGAGKLGLKIVDVPVHYMERVYGETKMKNRLKNGIHMLKLCLGGLFKLRFES